MTKKLALLVGCNYNDPKVPDKYKLHGCINDVNAMHALILQPRFGFHNNNIKILTDETVKKPTAANIKRELDNLIKTASQGDTLLFYFSGGGALVNTQDPNEIIPVIVPCDLEPIAGAHILSKIKPLPDKAILTFIFDSSYSGGLFQQNDPSKSNVAVNEQNFRSKTIPLDLLRPLPKDVKVHPFNNGILFTSSKSNEESVEVYLDGDKSKAFSAYSKAIQEMFNSPQAVNPPANSAVENFVKISLSNRKFSQQPYHKYSGNNADAPFLGGYVARG